MQRPHRPLPPLRASSGSPSPRRAEMGLFPRVRARHASAAARLRTGRGRPRGSARRAARTAAVRRDGFRTRAAPRSSSRRPPRWPRCRRRAPGRARRTSSRAPGTAREEGPVSGCRARRPASSGAERLRRPLTRSPPCSRGSSADGAGWRTPAPWACSPGSPSLAPGRPAAGLSGSPPHTRPFRPRRGGLRLARLRTIGSLGTTLLTAARRALIEKARAILAGREARLLEPGSPLDRARSSVAPGLWICVGIDAWDPLVREAVEAEAAARSGGVELQRIPATAPPPALPDEWRSALFVPAGVVASLRFYERLSEIGAAAGAAGAASAARRIVADPGWAAFAADLTGYAPLPRNGNRRKWPDASGPVAFRLPKGESSRRSPRSGSRVSGRSSRRSCRGRRLPRRSNGWCAAAPSRGTAPAGSASARTAAPGWSSRRGAALCSRAGSPSSGLPPSGSDACWR